LLLRWRWRGGAERRRGEHDKADGDYLFPFLAERICRSLSLAAGSDANVESKALRLRMPESDHWHLFPLRGHIAGLSREPTPMLLWARPKRV
jgi:hypothetical protein